ncbi:hypothetical protein [Actinomadura miaoliensis]|uniref:Uncharacterized protein n=1 Tax=Actinomadura miaoliensis TaxID=430685 RepID=A0ABP7VQZ1_9ACTN
MSEELDQLDRLILSGQVLGAVRLVTELFGCSLQEAIEFHYARYTKLRETRPDEFTTSPEEYWRGVYT